MKLAPIEKLHVRVARRIADLAANGKVQPSALPV